MRVGTEEGYIEKVSLTPANVSECKYFQEAIEGIETKRYYTDKGSASKENREYLKKKGITKWNYVHILQK